MTRGRRPRAPEPSAVPRVSPFTCSCGSIAQSFVVRPGLPSMAAREAPRCLAEDAQPECRRVWYRLSRKAD